MCTNVYSVLIYSVACIYYQPAERRKTLSKMTYNIKKSYEGSESKTNNHYEKGLSLEQAQQFLDATERSWVRNGGLVIERNNTALVVEEADASNTITFEIVEIEEWNGVN